MLFTLFIRQLNFLFKFYLLKKTKMQLGYSGYFACFRGEIMKRVILIFPDAFRLSRFVLQYKPANTEVNSLELSLTTFLTEDLIVIACTRFHAQLKKLIFAL